MSRITAALCYAAAFHSVLKVRKRFVCGLICVEGGRRRTRYLFDYFELYNLLLKQN